MRREIKWETKTGKQVTCTITLTTQKTLNADGDKVTVPCCEMNMWAEVEGMGIIGYGKPYKRDDLPSGAVAAIGKLAIKPKQYEAILTAIAEIETTPEWQAHLTQKAQNEKDDREYDEHRQTMRKVMGY